jgi:hypothetical protein
LTAINPKILNLSPAEQASYRGRQKLLSMLARVHGNAYPLWTAGRGSALLLANWILAAPPRIYVCAVSVGALHRYRRECDSEEVERHSSPLFAPANHQVSPASVGDFRFLKFDGEEVVACALLHISSVGAGSPLS